MKNAQYLKSVILELRPNVSVKIIEGDYNLYKLGFVPDIPCTIVIDMDYDEVKRLLCELDQLESNAYGSYASKSDREKYDRYCELQTFLFYI